MLAQARATIITQCETQAVGKVSQRLYFYTFASRHGSPPSFPAGRWRTRHELDAANCTTTKPIRAGIPKASSINSNHKLAS